MEKEKRHTGFIFITRSFMESELWLRKPATWSKIWMYIIERVNWKDSKTLKRGEGYFNFTQEKERIGEDITPSMIKSAVRYFKQNSMICSSKTTRGTVIKVLNYDKYQRLEAYMTTSSTTTEQLPNNYQTTTITKDKESKKDKEVTKQSLEPYDQTLECTKLVESTRRDLRLAGYYFKRRRMDLPTKAVFSKELKRALAEIKTLKDFEDNKIIAAFDYAENQYPEWTIETVGKTITKIK